MNLPAYFENERRVTTVLLVNPAGSVFLKLNSISLAYSPWAAALGVFTIEPNRCSGFYVRGGKQDAVRVADGDKRRQIACVSTTYETVPAASLIWNFQTLWNLPVPTHTVRSYSGTSSLTHLLPSRTVSSMA